MEKGLLGVTGVHASGGLWGPLGSQHRADLSPRMQGSWTMNPPLCPLWTNGSCSWRPTLQAPRLPREWAKQGPAASPQAESSQVTAWVEGFVPGAIG